MKVRLVDCEYYSRINKWEIIIELLPSWWEKLIGNPDKGLKKYIGIGKHWRSARLGDKLLPIMTKAINFLILHRKNPDLRPVDIKVLK